MMPNGASEKLTAEQLDAMSIGSVVYVGPTVRLATPYKRVTGGWKRFYTSSFRGQRGIFIIDSEIEGTVLAETVRGAATPS
jgi:hypothetical protein